MKSCLLAGLLAFLAIANSNPAGNEPDPDIVLHVCRRAVQVVEGPAANKPTAVDRYGDPLPPGAIARLGTVRFRTLTREPYSPLLAFSPDAKLLASANNHGRVSLWDTSTGREIHRFSVKNNGKPAFTQDGKVLTCGGVFWNVADGREIKPEGGSLPLAKEVAVQKNWQANSADGKFVAGVRGLGTIFVQDRATSKETCSFAAHDHCLLGLAFAPDALTLATSAEDGTVRLWEARTGKPLHTFTRHQGQSKYVDSVVFAPDGKILAAGVGDHTNPVFTGAQAWPRIAIRRWDPIQGKELKQWVTDQPCMFGPYLAISPDGETLAFMTLGERICIWSASTGKEVRSFPGPRTTRANTILAYSPDGRMLATPSFEGLVLWDVASGKKVKQFPKESSGVVSLAFSPDGKIVAGGDGSTFYNASSIHLWELASGKEIATLIGHKSWVSSVAFFPDGAILASASWDGTVRLWDVAEQRELQRLDGHDGPVSAVSLSADGKTLASGSYDTTALIWDVAGIRARLRQNGK